MTRIHLLCKLIPLYALLTVAFYTTASVEFGFKMIQAYGPGCWDNPNGSITISVISNPGDTVKYTLGEAEQITTKGVATFSNLKPKIYLLSVTNLTTGEPSLTASIAVPTAGPVTITSVAINPPTLTRKVGLVQSQALVSSGIFNFYFSNLPVGVAVIEVGQMGACQASDSVGIQIVDPPYSRKK